jgi:hypothetical protein
MTAMSAPRALARPVSCHACGKSFTVDQVASTLASVFRGHTGGVHPSTVKSLWFLCAGYDLHKDGHCDPSLPEHLHPIWRYPRSVTRHAEPGRAEDAPPHLGSCPQDENARQRIFLEPAYPRNGIFQGLPIPC